jgi:cell division protein FtsB
LAKYKAKNNELEGEKEKIEGQIKKINEDINKYFQVGTLVYLVAQHAD